MVLFWSLMMVLLITGVLGMAIYMIVMNYLRIKGERKKLSLTSKDGIHKIRFKFAGCIHQGPEYYTLIIDNRELADRYYFLNYSWSPDSSYFAVQDYVKYENNQNARSKIILFDIKKNKYSDISTEFKFAEWINDLKFVDNNNFSYKINSYKSKEVKGNETNIDIRKIANWKEY